MTHSFLGEERGELFNNYLNYISVIKLGKKLKLPILFVILFFLPFFNTYKCEMFSGITPGGTFHSKDNVRDILWSVALSDPEEGAFREK